MALKFVQAPTAAIALPMGDTDTSFYGLDIKDIDGNYLSMSDFGTIGYMTINPTSPFAEIVSFTGCVYQGDGTTLFTGVTRGLLAISPYTTGGTAYAHSPNDSIVFSINPQMLDQFVQKGQDATITGTFTFLYTKMPRASQTVTYGVGSDLWFATKEYVDGVATAGAPNASISTKGIGRVSVSPVDANIPIFVGDNDPRVPSGDVSGITQDMIDAIVNSDSPDGTNTFVTQSDASVTATADKIVKANASGKIDPGYIQNFAGDGSDGALTVASGTTNIDLGAAAVVIKQYTSVSITGTGAVTFSNPHANGTLIIIKSQGGVTLTSSTIPNLDASGMGAAGGAGGAATNAGGGSQQNTAGSDTLIVTNYQDSTSLSIGKGAPGSSSSGATAGSAFTNQYMYTLNTTALSNRRIVIAPGNGGGGGSGGQSQTSTAGAGGTGGRGGGGLVIQCGGALNFTSALGIDVSGKVGAAGANSSGSTQNGAGGGGGGGGSGMCLVLYNTLTAASGTVNAKGGNGGVGGNATCSGGGGGSGSGAGGGGSGGSAYTTAGGNGGAAGTPIGSNVNGNAGSSGSAGSGAGGGGGAIVSSGFAASNTGGAGGTGGTTSTSLWLITKNYYQA